MFGKIKFNQSYWIVFGGNVLEFYDVTLYGFLLLKLQSLFFPFGSGDGVSLVNYLAFASAYLARPAGGLLIGYIADYYRREVALKLSILLAAIPTLIVGMIPTYEHWGMWATFFLTLCRFLQGLCLGGEYAAVTTYIYENTPPERVNFVTSILNASNFVGAVTATLVGLLVTQPFMPEWSWRGAFLFGGFMSLVILRKRQALLKSPGVSLREKNEKPQSYFKFIFYHKLDLIRALVVGGMTSAPYMIFTIFITNYVGDRFGLLLSERILINFCICMCYVFIYPICGYITDFYGKARVMIFGSLSLGIVGGNALFFINSFSLKLIFAIQVLIAVLSMIFSGGANAFLASMYPKEVRCRGMTVSLTLGGAIFGALAPAMGKFFLNQGWGLGPLAFYFASLCILGIVAVHSGDRQRVMLKQA